MTGRYEGIEAVNACENGRINVGVAIPVIPYYELSSNNDSSIAFNTGGGEVLLIMAYMERLRPKGVPFSGFRYIKG